MGPTSGSIIKIQRTDELKTATNQHFNMYFKTFATFIYHITNITLLGYCLCTYLQTSF